MKQETAFHSLSIAIVAIASLTLLLFFFAWIEEENASGDLQYAGGIAIATSNVEPTRDFPSPILFVVPYVTISVIYRYGLRIKQSVRPRRRIESAIMLITSIAIMLFWLRLYVNNVADNEPSPEQILSNTAPETYTQTEVLQEIITPYFWLTLAGLALLIFLPFFDRRPEAEPPEYLKPTKPIKS